MVFSPRVVERENSGVLAHFSSTRVPVEPRRWDKPLQGCEVFCSSQWWRWLEMAA